MPCVTVQLPNGTTAICKVARGRRGICRFCGKPSARLCDWSIPHRIATRHGDFGDHPTCDKALCASCAVRVADNRDFCPDHPRQQLTLDVL